jgi:hypothetical protein
MGQRIDHSSLAAIGMLLCTEREFKASSWKIADQNFLFRVGNACYAIFKLRSTSPSVEGTSHSRTGHESRWVGLSETQMSSCMVHRPLICPLAWDCLPAAWVRGATICHHQSATTPLSHPKRSDSSSLTQHLNN